MIYEENSNEFMTIVLRPTFSSIFQLKLLFLNNFLTTTAEILMIGIRQEACNLAWFWLKFVNL